LDELFVDTTRMEKTSGTNEWFIRLLIATMVGAVAYLLRG